MKFLKYFILNYGTVGNKEKAVAFIEATDWLKNEKGVNIIDIAERIGLTESQMRMIRVKRRHVQGIDIDNLLQHYPETEQFFNNLNPPNQANEQMEPYLNGGNATQKLIKRQEEMIEMLRQQLSDFKEKLIKLEGENKALREIVTQRKQS